MRTTIYNNIRTLLLGLVAAVAVLAAVLTVLASGAPLAAAQVMGSSNYQLQSDSANFGGGYSSSASYTQQSTAGEIATGRSSSASNTVNAGYQQSTSTATTSPSPTPSTTPSPTPTPVTGGFSGFSPGSSQRLANPSDFQATPENGAVDLTWVPADDQRVTGVRIVRSETFYPTNPLDGTTVYQGPGAEFADFSVTAGKTYYYAIFSMDNSGLFSSGVVTSTFIPVPGGETPTPTATPENPFAGIPMAPYVDQRIANLTLGDFLFYQGGKHLLAISNGTIAINGQQDLTIRLPYNSVPEVLKTIAVSLTDPTNPGKAFIFLLRANKDHTYYEATIGPLGRTGNYTMNILVLDYQNRGLKQLSGSLQAMAWESIVAAQGSMGNSGFIYLILIILFIAIVVTMLVTRRLTKKRFAAGAGVTAAAIILMMAAYSFAHAAFNPEINYQGKLMNSSSNPVADGSYNIRFKLYTTATGGSPIWTETWCFSPDGGTTCNGTGTDGRVPLVSGLFSTMLGSTTPFGNIDFNQTLYLGVEIGGSGASPTWDGEMSPRKILGTVPAAFVASTLQGINPTEFLRSDVQNATSSNSTFFDVSQTGSGKIAEFFGAASKSVLSVLSNGNVGIGTTTPGFNLAVEGNSSLGNTATAGTFNATTTNATSTFAGGLALGGNLQITNLNCTTFNNAGKLTTDANGNIVCANDISGAGSGSDVNWTFTGSLIHPSTTTNQVLIGASVNTSSNILNVVGSADFSGNVGVGTTSPFEKLSVAGSGSFDNNVRASYFIATSSTASTFPYASTTAITVSGTASSSNEIISNSLTLNSGFNGFLQAVNGSVTASTTLSAIFGGTGWSSIAANTLLLGNGTGALATTSAGSNGQVLALVNGVPSWVATTTLSSIAGLLNLTNQVTGTLGTANGGTGIASTPTFGQVLVGNGSGGYTLTATSSLGLANGTVTSVNASGGTTGLSFSGGPVTSSGTLTLAGTLAVSNGGTGQTSFKQGWVGINDSGVFISSTSPTVAYVTATSTTATSTFAGGFNVDGTNGFNVFTNGNVAIGTNTIDTNILPLVQLNGKLLLAQGSKTGEFLLGSSIGGGGWDFRNNNGDLQIDETGIANRIKILQGSGNFGIGTSSPWRALSVNGSSDLGTNALAGYFTATSSTASTFPYASSTAITVSGTSSTTNAIVSNTLTLNSGLNGPLQANNGVVSATTSVGVTYGGTGLTSAPTNGQLLVGNSSGGYTLTATSSLGLGTGSVTSVNASGGTTGLSFSGGPVTTSGTLTLGGLLNTTSGGTGWGSIQANTILLGNGTGAIATTSAGTNGQTLTLVNGVPTWVATTTFSGGLSYANGNVTNTGVLSVTQNGGGTAQTGAITLASTSLALNGQTLGVAITNSGSTFTFTPTLSGTLNVTGGGTGISSYTPGDITYANSASTLARVASSTGGTILMTSFTTGAPSWVSTSTLGLGTVTSVNASGGTTGLSFSGGPVTSSGTLTLGGTLATSNGGTGWSNLQANTVLLGNGTGAISTTSAGTNGQVLALVNGVPTWTATTSISNGVTSITQNGGGTAQTGAIIFATSSQITNGITTGLKITNAAGTFTFAPTFSGVLTTAGGGTGWGSIQSNTLLLGNGTGAVSTTSAGTNGQTLALVNGVPTWVATTTYSSGLSYISGNVTNSGLLSLTQNGGGTAQTGAITFATSSATTFNGITIANAITNSGTTFTFAPSTLSGTLTVGGGGTGISSYTPGDITYANSASALARVASSTGGTVLMTSFTTGAPTWVATSSLGFGAGSVSSVNASGGTTGLTFSGGPITTSGTLTLAGTLAVANGGTGQTSFGQGWLGINDSGAFISSTSPTAAYFTATSTTGHSTFPYASTTAISVTGTASTTNLVISGLSGTSIRCLQINPDGSVAANATACGSAGGSGGGSWSTTTSQVAGELINYSNNTTDVVAIGNTATTTAKYWFDPNALIASFAGKIGIGTSSPGQALSVNGSALVSGSLTTTNVNATGTLTLSNLNGPLQAVNGAVSATNTLSVAYGGTGISSAPTFGQVLVGNSSGGYTLTATSSLGLANGTVTSVNASGGTTGLSFSGGPVTTSGTLTLGGTLAVTNGGTGWTNIAANTLLLGNGTGSLATTSAGTNGQTLALVNGVPTWVATTTFSSGLSYVNGNVTNTGVLSITQNGGGTAQAGAITLSTSTLVLNGQTLGVAITNAGGTFTLTPTLSGTLNVTGGGTGISSFTPGDITYANTASTLARVASSTGGSILMESFTTGAPSWVSTSTLGLGTVTSVNASGGTTGLSFSGGPVTSSGTLTLGGTLATANGGTGWSNLQANTVLLGNGTGAISTTSAGTNGQVLALVNGVPTWVATSTVNNGVTSVQQNGGGTAQTGAITLATSSQTTNGLTTGLNITNAGGTFTFAPTLSGTLSVTGGGTGWGNITANTLLLGNGTGSLATTSAGSNGQTLALVNGVPTWVATTTFSTGLSYSSGAVTNTGLLSLTQNGGGTAQTGAITLSTSTASTFNGLTIANAITNSGGTFTFAPDKITGTLNVTGGGTGISSFAPGDITYANSASTLARVASSTGGTILMTSFTTGAPSWIATSSLGLGTVTSVNASGGTTGLSFSGGPVTNSGTLTLGGTLATTNGGTGWTNLQANTVLLGNGTGAISTTSAGTNGQVLALVNGVPTWTATTSISNGVTSITQNGGGTAQTGAITLATSTLALNGQTHGIAITNAGGTFTLTPTLSGTLNVTGGGTGWSSFASNALLFGNGTGALATTSAGTNGQTLALVNGVPTWVATTTFGTGLSYASGSVTNTGVLSITQNGGGTAQSGSLTFATSSATSFNGLTIANAITNSGTTFTFAPNKISGTLTVAGGGTGISSYTPGDITYANSANSLARVSSSTGGTILMTSFTTGAPTWVATSSLGLGGGTVTSVNASGGTTGLTFTGGPVTSSGTLTLGGTLAVANGGTGQTSFGQGWLGINDSGAFISSTSPTVNYITATSTATSTFAGGIQTALLNVTSNATSSFTNGINLANGCFAVNGVCLGGGSGSGTVNTGTAGQVAYYVSNGSTVSGTSTLFLSPSGNVGIGTTSPWRALSVNGSSDLGVNALAGSFTATNTSATSTFAGGLNVGSNGLVYDFTSGVTTIASLRTTAINFDTDAGAVSWVDLPIDTVPTNNTIESYSANLNGTPVLTVFGQADGAGNIKNTAVGIGTTSPYAPLSVVGQVVASYFTATSTTASTFPYASTTAVTVSGTASSSNEVISNSLTLNSGYNGPLQAVNGVVSATGTLSVAYGGTGTSTAPTNGQILVGNSSGTYNLMSTSSLGLGSVSSVNASGGTTGLSFAGGPITSSGTLTLGGTLNTANGGTGWGSIAANTLLIGNGTGALATTSGGTNGQTLALVNGVPTWVATTTFSSGLAYSNGNVTNTGLLSLTQNGGGTAQTGAITLSTSTLALNGQTHGIAITNTGSTFTFTPTLSGTLNVTGGGTGIASYTPGDITYANSASTLARVASSTGGTILMTSFTTGAPSWVSTSSLGLANGTVTSVNASGGTTGLSFSGGPVTSTGTLTLGGTLAAANGGTGWANITANALLLGNGTGSLATTSAGTNGQTLALINGVPTWVATTTFSSGLTYSNGNVTNTGVLSVTQNGGGTAQTGALTLATSTATSFNGLTIANAITNSGGTFTFAPDKITGTLTVGGGGTGISSYTPGDITYANSASTLARVASSTGGSILMTSFTTGAPSWIATSSLGLGTVTSVNASGGTTGLSFSGGPVTTSGTLTLGGTLGTANGGTGWTNLQANTVLLGNGTGAISTTSAGTNGQVLALVNGVPTWVATSSVNNGVTSITQNGGGTAQTGAITFATSTLALNGQTHGIAITNSGSTFTFTPTLTGTLNVTGGGTGWGNITANTLLLGNGTGSLATTSAGTNGQTLALVNGVPTWVATTTFGTGLSYAGGSVTNTGVLSITQNGGGTAQSGSLTFATSTASSFNGLTISNSITNSGTTFTFAPEKISGTLTVGGGGTGISSFTPGDITYANTASTLARVASSTGGTILMTSFTTGAPSWVSTSSLGLANGTVTSVNASGGTTGLSFSGGPVTTSGTLTLGGTLAAANGGTGWGNIAANALLLGNGTGSLATTSAGTNGQVLALVNGVPIWQATTTLSNISGTLAVGNGGTGATSFAGGWIYSPGGTSALTSSSSPTVNYITATSTTATSTFAGGIMANKGIDVPFGVTYEYNDRPLAYANSSGSYFFGNAGTGVSGTGSNDLGIGDTALSVLNGGSGNTAVGVGSLKFDTTGGFNTAMGVSSLGNSTTGANNVAIGYGASQWNASATSTVAIGYSAGSGVIGFHNQNGVYIGYQSGISLDNGSDNNILIGYQAGYNLGTGNTNLIIGYNVDAASSTGSQQLNIGNVLFGSGIYNGATVSSAPAVNGDIGIGTSSPFAKLSVSANNGDTNTNLFLISSSTASATSTLFVVQNNGNVGIGTSTPNAQLTLRGTDSTSNTNGITLVDSNNTTRLAIKDNGTTVFGSLNLNTAAPAQAVFGEYSSSQGWPMFVGNWSSSGVWGVGPATGASDNTLRAGVTSALSSTWSGDQSAIKLAVGNSIFGTTVGIGTTSPYAALSVVGSTGVVADHYAATGTVASTFPYASTTALSATTLCLSTDCRTAWPSSGGTGGGTWSTTTSQVAGELVNYSNNASDIVAIGGTATTSAKFWFDPNALVTSLTGNVGIGTVSPFTNLQISGSKPMLSLYDTGAPTSAHNWYLSSNSGSFYVGTTSDSSTLSTTTYLKLTKAGNGDANTDNIALGYQAISATTTGYGNVGLGRQVLTFNTTGIYNTGVGFESMQANASGGYNTAVGESSLGSNTTGSYNVALGGSALGGSSNASKSVGVGYLAAGQSAGNILGGTYIGYEAGLEASNGGTTQYNTLIGYYAGLNVNTGYGNTIIGSQPDDCDQCGFSGSLTTGHNNIGVGSDLWFPSATGNNQLDIGNFIYGTNLTATSSSGHVPSTLTGKLGLATSTPLSTLTVAGNASIGADYNIAAPTNGLIVEGNVGVGTTSPFAQLSVQGSASSPFNYFDVASTTGKQTLTFDQSGALSLNQGQFYSHYDTSKYSPGSGATINPILSQVDLHANDNLGSTQGGYFWVNGNSAGAHKATTTELIGVNILADPEGTDYTNAYGIKEATPYLYGTAGTNYYGYYAAGLNLDGGSITSLTNNYGFYVGSTFTNHATENLTNNYGMYITSPFSGGGSAIANNYALYIADQSNAATNIASANTYSIYSVGGKNYFGGNVGIGTTSPYAALSVVGASGVVANRYTATGTLASVFPYASTTALSATTLCISTDCRTAWPTGGSGGGTWSTTTSQVAGELVNYSNNASDIVAIGGTATTSAKFWFDPNALISSFTGNVGIGTSSPYAALSVVGASGVVADHYAATNTNATSTFAGNVAIGGAGIYTNNNSLASGQTGGGGTLTASGIGATALGRVLQSGGTAATLASGNGSLAGGSIVGASGSTGAITASQSGALAWGFVNGNPFNASITSSGAGSIALGYANNGTLQATANGSVALGAVFTNLTLQATGIGAFAGGRSVNGNVTSSGNGSFAFGDNLTSSGDYATAFGSGFTNGTTNSFMVGYSSTPTLTVNSSNVGIGTTSPWAQLSVNALNGSTNTTLFAIASSTSNSTTTLFVVNNNGNVGIGTTSPYTSLAVNGLAAAQNFNADNASATSTFSGGLNVGNGAITYDWNSGTTSIPYLETGNMSFAADSGIISWIDMPVTTASAAGVVDSYSASLNGNPILTIYGVSNGSAGLSSTAVGIGTTTPYGYLSAAASTTNPAFVVSQSTSNTANGPLAAFISGNSEVARLTNAGRLGLGTSTPWRTLSVTGSSDLGNNALAGYFTATSTTASTFPYASTTALSATTICISTDCRTAWPTGGGGSAGGTWSTTTSTVSGELVNYSNNNTDVVAIGGNSTSTAKYWFDPNQQLASFSGSLGIGTTFTNGYTLRVVGGDVSFGSNLSLGGYLAGNTVVGGVNTGNSLQLQSSLNTPSGGDVDITGRNIILSPLTNGVGIGTTTPWRTLSVTGSSDLGNNALAGYFTATSTTASTFPYASTTALSATTICISTDCRTAWPTSGGGSAGGTWSTTTSSVSGELVNYSNNNTDIVAIGGTATTSAKFWFDPNALVSSFSGKVGIGTTSPKLLNGSSNTLLDIEGTTNPGVALNNTNGGKQFMIYSGNGTNPSLKFYDATSGFDRMVIDNSGNVGIGSTTPWKALSVNGDIALSGDIYKSTPGGTITISPNYSASFPAVDNIFPATGKFRTAEVSILGTNDIFNQLFPATSAGYGMVEAWQSAGLSLGTGGNSSPILFQINRAEQARLTGAGFGLGTTSPWRTLSVTGSSDLGNNALAGSFTATSTTATSTIAGGLTVGNNGLVYDSYSGVTSISSLQTGTMSFDTDAGAVTWADLPIDSSAANNTVESYSAALNGTPMFTIYGQADGSGNIKNAAVGIGTTSPYAALSVVGSSGIVADHYTATSTATSTFTGGIQANLLNITSTTATSSFANGIDLKNGCYAVNGTCIGGGSGNGTVNTGTQGQVAYYDTSTNAVSGTSTISITSASDVGIGTSSPTMAQLSVDSGSQLTGLLVTGSVNNYLQSAMWNRNSGGTGSTDFVVVNDQGTPSGTSYYADFGLNSSKNADTNFPIQWANDAYLYNQDGGLVLTAATSTAAGRIVFSTGGFATSTIRMTITNTGNVGIGTTSPYAALSVVGSSGVVASIYDATNTSATSTFAGGLVVDNGSLTTDFTSGVTSISALETGNLNFDTNAGLVSWADLPITNAAAAGTDEGYVAQLDGSTLLQVWGQSDGAGGVKFPKVVIGTSTDAILGSSNIPDNSLIVANGALCVQRNGANGGNTCATSARSTGTIYAVAASVSALDLAEQYPTADSTLGPGDVLMADPSNPTFVAKYSADGASTTPPILGIVSTAPGLLLGGFDANASQVPVALSGRVPVKVNLEGGAIAVGDRLAPSSVAGIATKATTTGYTVGIALQAVSSIPAGATYETVTSFVDRSYYVVSPAGTGLAATTNISTSTGTTLTSTSTGTTSPSSTTSTTTSTTVASNSASSGTTSSANTTNTDALTSEVNSLAVQVQVLSSTTSDLSSTVTSLASTTSTLSASSTDYEVRITTLENITSTSSMQNAVVATLNSSTTPTIATSSSFMQTLVGAVESAISAAGNFVVTSLTAHVAYIDTVQAKSVITETASISNGLEMTDAATGSIWCVKISNGNWTKVQGTCGSAATTTIPTVMGNPLNGTPTATQTTTTTSGTTSTTSTTPTTSTTSTTSTSTPTTSTTTPATDTTGTTSTTTSTSTPTTSTSTSTSTPTTSTTTTSPTTTTTSTSTPTTSTTSTSSTTTTSPTDPTTTTTTTATSPTATSTTP